MRNLEFFEKLPLSEQNKDVYKKLCAFAGRIDSLLGLPEVQSNSSWEACLDDLLGAVYGFYYAKRHAYADRNTSLNPEYMRLVRTRATDMSNLRVRTEGLWTAGFYFNSALFRVAAVYHRSLKIVAGKEASVLEFADLLSKAEKLFKDSQKHDWTNTNLGKVNSEVNDLKHAGSGIYDGRHVQFDDALQALDEMVNFIEALRGSQSSNFAAQRPPLNRLPEFTATSSTEEHMPRPCC